MLVNFENFIFPVDFVILDMDTDTDVPLILGWPFLATARAIIDVADGQLVLHIREDELVVKTPIVLKQSIGVDDTCYAIDVIDNTVFRSVDEILCKDPLELSLTACDGEEINDTEV